MRFSLLVIALAFSSNIALAKDDKIPYVPMSFCKTSESDLRAEWDKQRRVCFTAKGNAQSLIELKGKVHTYLLSDMGEIKLRENGKWMNNEYVSALGSADALNEIGSYDKYYVRYMSIAKPVNGVMPFLASVFFSWGPGTQTMYVFGEITKDGVRLTGFSNADGIDGDIRAAYNTVKNLLVIFDGENPNTVGVKQTQDEDRARAQGVKSVVQKYRSTVQGEKTINTVRP